MRDGCSRAVLAFELAPDDTPALTPPPPPRLGICARCRDVDTFEFDDDAAVDVPDGRRVDCTLCVGGRELVALLLAPEGDALVEEELLTAVDGAAFEFGSLEYS